MGVKKPRKRSKEGRIDRAIQALLEHSSIEKAAASLGLSYVTLWRWMQEKDFQTRLRAARRQAYSQSVARLQQASSAAVTTLLRVMTDQSAPAGSRVRAADCVLDHAARAIELEDIEQRLDDLESEARSDEQKE
jgi:molybdenum-dependent DNA-binding transcriptional regulator ModE